MSLHRIQIMAVAGLTAIAISHGRAQSSALVHSAALVAGASQFDLSGTGTTGIVGARFENDIRRWLAVEAAVGFMRPEEQFGSRTLYTIPEGQLQLQFPGRTVRPYLGAGGGYVFASGGRGSRGTASGSTGFRVALPGNVFDARAELRVRGIGETFGGAAAEWTLGVGRRF
jgi:hypothetical protein